MFPQLEDLVVSRNNGTPKSSILIGFSIINHPFWWCSPYFWKHPFTILRLTMLKITTPYDDWGALQKLCCIHPTERTVLTYPVHWSDHGKKQKKHHHGGNNVFGWDQETNWGLLFECVYISSLVGGYTILYSWNPPSNKQKLSNVRRLGFNLGPWKVEKVEHTLWVDYPLLGCPWYLVNG